MKPQPKGYSLHIGVNYINASAYQKELDLLEVCSQDAETLASLARYLKYTEVKELINKEATSKNLISQLEEYAQKMVAGDTLFLTFSGHGSFRTDVDYEEKDHKDEGWCLYDRRFFDDELYRLWFKFKEDVRIIVVSDSCYSGTITKDFKDEPAPIPKEETELNEPLCTVKLLASSLEGKVSMTDGVYSLFTKKVLTTWFTQNGKHDNYLTFFNKIKNQMSPDAPPAHYTIGKPNPLFENSKTFHF